MDVKAKFSDAARKVTESTGSWWACSLMTACILAWCVGGLFVGFTEGYQMYVNTCTSVITFLMVFFIQHTQNRESKTVQIKLDELILAVRRADNALLNVEEMTEEELQGLQSRYKGIAEEAREDSGTVT